MDSVERLTQFGLTRHEAAIYLTLLSEGDLNGYEVAKVTGISRSNTYTSLASLVEKGAAYVIEEATIRYTPVSIKEFCENKIRKLQESEENLVRTIPSKRDAVEGYITIKGEINIMNKLQNMILEAKERVYISVSVLILNSILTDIKKAIQRGIKMVIITNEAIKLEGAIIYTTSQPLPQIRLIADSTNVLTGDINNGEHSTCLYSHKQNLVDLFKDSMKNEIKLIELTKGNR
ncbi:TrmB family transcriptional regulator [Acetobacterium woodii]|uniref:Transcriptional regulator TrmB2 n=1 Tax=Acetobacterium woodii (strain ATCC 29683 / DSM 1030 / JCM 2381 / KCTC 1655 / WB1) TaxID=931626 RepID=H6LI10_ACEWD|nr:helix-turn-helix domain-containing protein [Acetobacterium woodii]AFA48540.1 transcriptional regulator TrmB2 [Acetobacterium woodii DSM 1030]